jgi:hypothetical protein
LPSKVTPYIHPSLFTHLFSVSIFCVAISERLLLLLMGDVNHRCAHKKKKKKHVHSTSRANAQKKEKKAVVVFFNIPMLRHTGISSNACTSHTFCRFFSLALMYALSLFGGIYRRRVMTRKERGEDVYGCMLDQTLKMMKAVRRVIQSTVLKKEKKSKRERCDSDGIPYVI